MKAYSAIQQDSILVIDKSELNLKLCVRWNEKETTKTDMGGSRIEYEYDEVYIDHVIPSGTKLEDINTYLESAMPAILIQAKAKAEIPEPVIVKDPIPGKTMLTISAVELNKLIDQKNLANKVVEK